MLQASHVHGCVQLLQLSLHTKNYKNHCSTSGVIAIFVVVSALLPDRYTAYFPEMFQVYMDFRYSGDWTVREDVYIIARARGRGPARMYMYKAVCSYGHTLHHTGQGR